MKKHLLIVPVLALALSATAATAQQTPPAGSPPPGMSGGGGGGGGGGRRMQALLQGITLTAAQQTAFDSITAAYRGKMPAMTPGTPPDSATRAQMRVLSTERDGLLRARLTPEQQRVWDTNVQNVQAQMQQPRPND